MADTTLICLHYLGGSARSWDWVAARLAPNIRVVALDLPGFGDACHQPGYTKADMADVVAARVEALAPERWALIGHSMGGAVATILARRAENGVAALANLAGIVLVAASPPGPEPMDDSKRAQMVGWAAGGPIDPGNAHGFITQNVTASLPAAEMQRACDDVTRANPAAWRHWLEIGCRENWSARIGTLRTPALILAGADDEALGPDAQRTLTAPHFADATLAVVPGAKHLLPLERPDALATSISEFLA